MEAAEARPPYVTFETKGEEDRAASIEAGHYIARDVDYAIVTPQGSKDRIERNVQDWFAQLAQQVSEGRMPGAWLTAFREGYKAWKEGRELPLNGTPILTWAVAAPHQVKALLDARVRTVEDLAQANEETMARLGMGGRALKDKAVSWLTSAGSTGKVAEQLAALKLGKELAEAQVAALSAQVDKLAAQVAVFTQKTK